MSDGEYTITWAPPLNDQIAHLKARAEAAEAALKKVNWQSIDSAPKDRDILLYGGYVYSDDDSTTHVYKIGSWVGGGWAAWPPGGWETDEGIHPPDAFSKWAELTPPNDTEEKRGPLLPSPPS